MQIAVVGCGWLGFPLAKSFVDKGHIVYGSTTHFSKINLLSEANINPVIWSLNVPLKELSFLEGIDVLVLNIPPSKTKDDQISYSNTLKGLGAYIGEKTKVLFVSTTGVYPDGIEIADVSIPYDIMDQSKETVLAEIKLREVLKNRLTILRLAGLIGPNRHPITSLSKKGIVSNGDAPINLIHLDDVIGLINKIIEEEYWGEIINGCYPEHPTKKEYYTRAAHHYDLSIPKFIDGGYNLKKVDHSSLLNYHYEKAIFEFN
jgi:nucleoside-diphosphate-sugar epimerase